jgi:hypothetical protein
VPILTSDCRYSKINASNASVVENNPELKANEAITKFMDELTDTADKLTYARRSVMISPRAIMKT